MTDVLNENSLDTGKISPIVLFLCSAILLFS